MFKVAYRMVCENCSRMICTAVGFAFATILLVLGLFYLHVSSSVVQDNFNHALLEQRILLEEVYVSCVDYYESGEDMIADVKPTGKNTLLALLTAQGVTSIKVEYELPEEIFLEVDGNTLLVEAPLAADANYDIFSEALVNSLKKEQENFTSVVAGRKFEVSEPMTAMVGEVTLALLQIDADEIVGKEIEAVVGGQSYTITITGVYAKELSGYYRSAPEEYTNSLISGEINSVGVDILFNQGFFKKVFQDNGEGEIYPTGIYATVNDTKYIDELIQKMQADYSLLCLSDYQNFYEQIQEQERMAGMFLFLGGFILLLILLMIINTIIINITQQKRFIGLLRLLGYTKMKIRMFFMYQSVIFCIIGTGVGAFLSYIFCTYVGYSMFRSLEGYGVASSNFLLPVRELLKVAAVILVISAAAGFLCTFVKTFGKEMK